MLSLLSFSLEDKYALTSLFAAETTTFCRAQSFAAAHCNNSADIGSVYDAILRILRYSLISVLCPLSAWMPVLYFHFIILILLLHIVS